MIKKISALFTMLVMLTALLGALAETELCVYAPELLCAGETVKLTTNTQAAITWQSGDTNVATVGKNGHVTARRLTKPATVTIYARTKDGEEASATLTVVPAASNLQLYIGDVRVTWETYELDLYTASHTLNVSAVTTPDEAVRGITWESGNQSIAQVDENGTVSILAPGKVKITARLLNDRNASLTINAGYDPYALELSGAQEAFTGDKVQLLYRITPEYATEPTLRWRSDNTDVARVNADGVVTLRKAGSATITLTCRNNLSASTTISVYDPVKSLSFPKKTLTLGVGSEESFAVSVSPKHAKYEFLTYASSNPAVAVVDSDGLITAVGAGKCVISCSADNGKRAEVNLTVKFIPLTGVKFVSMQAAMLVGERADMRLEYTPANASNKQVRYVSDNPSVVTTDENGDLFAVGAGRANVSVYLPDGAKPQDGISVRVRENEDYPLSGLIIGLNPGHQITRDYTQLPLAPGWKTTGNANSGYAIGVKTGNTEYEINLQIALKLRDELEALGARVVMTRTENDVKINNVERAKMLNEANVDMALQIHCDNNDDSSKSGASIFVKSKDTRSAEISQYLIDCMCDETGAKNYGVRKYDMFMSLNWTETDTALIECGYMSNAQDDERLGDAEYQQKLARGLAKGFVAYYESERVEVK